MKRVIKKNLVTALLMLTTLIGYANDGNVKDKITHLTFENVKNGSVLTIKDSNGLTLYKEVIKKSGTYSKGFDLTALPDGNYTFELEKDVEIKIIPFKVLSNEVVFEKDKQLVINKPMVIDKNNFIFVSKLSLNLSPMEVMIYHENGDLVYKDILKNKQNLERVYDFSNSINGNYKIVLKTDGREFTKYIKI